MSNKRIDQLPNIASLNLADLIPLWDSSASTTGYATLTQLQALIGSGSFLKLDGTSTMAGNIVMGGNDITGIDDITGGSGNIKLTSGTFNWSSDNRINIASHELVANGGLSQLDWFNRIFYFDWRFNAKARFASGQAIADANGNNLIGFPATIASAVNWLQVSNAISGNPVLLTALGSDTNIGINYNTKGTGTHLFNANIRFASGRTISPISTGGAATCGRVTLVAGTATVSTTAVTANSIILLQRQSNAGSTAAYRIINRVAGTSFDISSSVGADVAEIGWFIVEPY